MDGEVLAEFPVGKERKILISRHETEYTPLLRIGIYQIPLDAVDQPYSGVVFPIGSLDDLIEALQDIRESVMS